MEIRTDFLDRMTLDQFATAHGLILVIRERVDIPDMLPYYAWFENIEVKDGEMFSGTFGEGVSPGYAIADYTANISGKLLIKNAYSKNRKEIRAPVLISIW